MYNVLNDVLVAACSRQKTHYWLTYSSLRNTTLFGVPSTGQISAENTRNFYVNIYHVIKQDPRLSIIFYCSSKAVPVFTAFILTLYLSKDN